MKILGQILKYLGIYFISLVLFAFSISKFLNMQFQVYNYTQYIPLKDLDLFSHAWSFFGRSYNYNVFMAMTELSAGLLILFGKTRLAGLLLAAGIYTNILIINMEFKIGAHLHAAIEFIIILLLLLPYGKDLKKFFWDMGGRFTPPSAEGNKFLNLILPAAFILISSIVLISILKQEKLSQNKITGAYRVSEFILNADTLNLEQGKYTRDPMLFFEFGNRCILSSNDTAYWGSYSIKSDSIFLNLDIDYTNIKNISAVVSDDFKNIKGITDKSDLVEINMQSVKAK